MAAEEPTVAQWSAVCFHLNYVTLNGQTVLSNSTGIFVYTYRKLVNPKKGM